jgi:hypothetical protein
MATRVWLDPDRLQLVAPFLVSVLPEGAVSAIVRTDAGLTKAFAPEIIHGTSAPTTDLYGVACIAFQALFGRMPAPGEPTPGRGELGVRLSELLVARPHRRPPSLEPLLVALADAASLEPPSLDPGTFSARADETTNRRVHAISEPATTRMDADGAFPEEAPPTEIDNGDMDGPATSPTLVVSGGVSESAYVHDHRLQSDDYIDEAPTHADAFGVQAHEAVLSRPRSPLEKPARGGAKRPGASDAAVHTPASPVLAQRVIEGAASGGTMEVDVSHLMDFEEDTKLETRGDELLAKARARPTRAGRNDSGTTKPLRPLRKPRSPGSGELDPRLVRAALGVVSEPDDDERTGVIARAGIAARRGGRPPSKPSEIDSGLGSAPPSGVAATGAATASGSPSTEPASATSASGIPSGAGPSRPAFADRTALVNETGELRVEELEIVEDEKTDRAPMLHEAGSLEHGPNHGLPEHGAPERSEREPVGAARPAPGLASPPEAAALMGAAAASPAGFHHGPASGADGPAPYGEQPLPYHAGNTPVRRDATPRLVATAPGVSRRPVASPGAAPGAAPAARRSFVGWFILLGAMVLAVLIVAGGVWIATVRDRVERERREERLQERYEQLQRGEQPPPDLSVD